MRRDEKLFGLLRPMAEQIRECQDGARKLDVGLRVASGHELCPVDGAYLVTQINVSDFPGYPEHSTIQVTLGTPQRSLVVHAFRSHDNSSRSHRFCWYVGKGKVGIDEDLPEFFGAEDRAALSKVHAWLSEDVTP